MRRAFVVGVLLAAPLLVEVAPARATHKPGLEAGFRLLYELKFEEARARFQSWQKANPADPLGHAAEAASYLFEEFYRQGVLTSEFFLDDKKLLEGVEGRPNEASRMAFMRANEKAQELARGCLKKTPKDAECLFALTIATGMQADYAGLIEKRHFESLKLTRRVEEHAKNLLVAMPDAHDAYLALGAANYIIGCLPAHKRFIVWFGGIRGDRRRGMMQLEKAAMGGHYLRPFAKILLALVALREKQTELARRLLEELTAEFPENPIFARELAVVKKRSTQVSSTR